VHVREGKPDPGGGAPVPARDLLRSASSASAPALAINTGAWRGVSSGFSGPIDAVKGTFGRTIPSHGANWTGTWRFVTFLTKPFRDQDLLDAIRNAIERDRAERGERHELTELRRRYASLTPRERDVLRGVVAGPIPTNVG